MLQYLANSVFDAFVNTFIQGSATVAATNTFVDVTGSFPTTYQVNLTPLNDPTVRYWVSFKSSSKFTITLSAAAPVGGVNFDYLVKGV